MATGLKVGGAVETLTRTAAREIKARFDEDRWEAQVAPFAVTVEEMLSARYRDVPGREELRREIRRHL